MRPPHPRPSTSADPDKAAWIDGLRLLAGRELSEAHVRQRLARRGHPPGAIENAVARLRESGAVDDRRVAAARARTELLVKGRGRLRAYRQITALGIDADTAEAAVNEVAAGVDERDLVERALDRRLRGRPRRPLDTAAVARHYRHLVGQGFAPGLVMTVLRARSRQPGGRSDTE